MRQHGWMQGHSAKWNKPDAQGKVVHDVTYM
jgi:hypothetical protein